MSQLDSGPHRELSTSEMSALLSNALVEADDGRRHETLKVVFSAFEQQPLTVPMLFGQITSIVTDGRSFDLSFWAAEVIELVLSKAQISPEMRSPLLIPSLGPIARLMADDSVDLQKKALGILASAYPGLFKIVCNGSDQNLWSKVVSLKTNALRLWRTGHAGARYAALKFIQRIIQTQTKGNADPRLSRNAEPNLQLVRPGHPFLRPQLLEDEANKLLEECITLLFTSPSADLVSAIVNVFTQLAKIRPALSNLILTSLTNWAPNALTSATPLQVRSAEKTVRIALNHLLRSGHATQFQSQINSFFQLQAQRMEGAATLARRQREQDASRKRQLIAEELDQSSKRRRIESGTAINPVAVFSSSSTDMRIASFDATSLPLQTVVELLVNNFNAVDERRLQAAIAEARNKLPPDVLADARQLAPGVPAVAVKEEPVVARAMDPLRADLGDEELDMNAEASLAQQQAEEASARAAAEQEADAAAASGAANDFATSSFSAAALEDLSSDLLESARLTSAKARTAMVLSSVKRICDAGMEGNAPSIWVPLVVRLITRGLSKFVAEERDQNKDASTSTDGAEASAEQQQQLDEDDEEDYERREALRQYLFDFIISSSSSNRLEFAKLWLNEEWYASGMERAPGMSNGHEQSAEDEGDERKPAKDKPYERWLDKLLDSLLTKATNKDKYIVSFLSDLPLLSEAQIRRLESLCLKQHQLQVGYASLRELVQTRPPSRRIALDVLLGLATHTEKLIRNAAINTLKRWVPELPEVSEIVTNFAVSVVSRLSVAPPESKSEETETANGAEAGGVEDGDGKAAVTSIRQAPFALVKNGQVVDRLPPPTNVAGIIQHVELLFGLTAKHHILLRKLFELYGSLQPFVQESLLQLVTPLIRALGIPNVIDTKVVEDSPEGGELLLHQVLLILQDKSNRLPRELMPLVIELAHKRKLPDKFYPMIIGDCDKAHIIEYLPFVVSTLDGTPTNRTTVRSVFLSLITPVNASSTVPRAKSELLMPVELMSILHTLADNIGVKKAIEAIGICFSMPDAFRQEILISFMQHMLDQPVLPTLFMRTVIQAATTYKGLQAYVSTTLLSRLVSKEIWTMGPLWEGFIRCAKLTAPQSFGALLQLPPDQVREIVEKQPTLKEGLRDYAMKRVGFKDKHPEIVEILGGFDAEEGGQDEQQLAYMSSQPLAI